MQSASARCPESAWQAGIAGYRSICGGYDGGMSGPGPGGMLFCLSNVAAVQFP